MKLTHLIVQCLEENKTATLSELVEYARKYIEISEEQVYAGVQSLASRKRVGRGTSPRTWTALGEVVVEQKPKAKKKQSGVSNDDVIEFLTSQELTELPEQPKAESAYMVVLDSEHTGEYILNRAEMVLKYKPTKWFRKNIGESLAIGVL